MNFHAFQSPLTEVRFAEEGPPVLHFRSSTFVLEHAFKRGLCYQITANPIFLSSELQLEEQKAIRDYDIMYLTTI